MMKPQKPEDEARWVRAFRRRMPNLEAEVEAAAELTGPEGTQALRRIQEELARYTQVFKAQGFDTKRQEEAVEGMAYAVRLLLELDEKRG